MRLAYAVTTNKSQGQTLQRAGLWLPSPLFTHGQLYVAMSRVGHPSNIKVLVHNGNIDGEEGTFTDNVVYHEVLDEADVEDDLLNLSLAETDFDASE